MRNGNSALNTGRHGVAVLGLGPLGRAVLSRLRDHGLDARGWSRGSDRDLHAVLKGAGVVLLALPDAEACSAVLRDLASVNDVRIVNLSTIGPSEAAGFAARLGSAYVHAPVLGSVSAARSGSLRVIAAGPVDDVADVVECLGDVTRVADAYTAAALKLVANVSLAGATVALREALQQAQGLGIERADALDVLELGALGPLVARKRPLLEGRSVAAEFALRSLEKDLTLAVLGSQAPSHLVDELAGRHVEGSADFASLALQQPVDDAVLDPLHAYTRGHATGDPSHFLDAFLPSAHIEGVRDGRFVSWTLEEYVGLFSGLPAADEATRRRRIDSVRVRGTVATASMTLWHGPDVFTDMFLLVRVDDRWRIANKVYHRAS